MPQAKKSNIYKAVTTLPHAEGSPQVSRTEYVRAKTKAGAKAIVADEFIKVELATQDDLMALANITVKG